MKAEQAPLRNGFNIPEIWNVDLKKKILSLITVFQLYLSSHEGLKNQNVMILGVCTGSLGCRMVRWSHFKMSSLE